MSDQKTPVTLDCTPLITLLLSQGWAAFQSALAQQTERTQAVFADQAYFSNLKECTDDLVVALANGQLIQLGVLLAQGDERAILAWHTQLDECDRQALWARVQRIFVLVLRQSHRLLGERGERLQLILLSPAQRHCLGLFFLLSCPVESFHANFLNGLVPQQFAPYLADLRPDLIARTHNVIRDEVSPLALPIPPIWIQALVELKQLAQPSSDFYLLALLANAPPLAQLCESASTIALLPRLFQLEGTQELSFSSCDKYGKSTPWATLLLQLAEQGLISRADLLNWTLESLTNDWIQFRSGWFSRLHDALAPSLDELTARSDRYLSLCHSRIGPTVSMALAALKKLQKSQALSGSDLLMALKVVLTGSHKGQISSAAKLLDQQLKTEPTLKAAYISALLPALAFDDASLQAQLLSLLLAWGLEDEHRTQLAAYQPYIASSQQALLCQLLGELPVKPMLEPALYCAPAILPHLELDQFDPLHPDRQIAQIKDNDTLIIALSQLFETPNDCDLLEQVLAGIVQLAPFNDVKPFAMLVKRAKQLIKQSPNRNVAYFVLDILGAAPPDFAYWSSDQGSSDDLLRQRLKALRDWAGQGLPALDCATHQGGYIAPAILLQRWVACLQAAQSPTLRTQISALMRLPAKPDLALCAQAANLPESDFLCAFRYALGDRIVPSEQGQALFLAAARIRSPKQNDSATRTAYGEIIPGSLVGDYQWQSIPKQYVSGGKVHYLHILQLEASFALSTLTEISTLRRSYQIAPHVHHWGEPSIWGIRYLASLLPSDYSLPMAQGLLAIGNNLDWDEAHWEHRAYLDLLLDAQVCFDALSLNVLILALAGKEPGITALARDVLLNAWLAGRLSAQEAGVVLAQWLPDGLVKPARYAKCFKALSRMHALAPQLVFQLLCHALPLSLALKDWADLLALLLELKIELQQKLPQALDTALQTLALTGKAKTILRELRADVVYPV